MHPLPSYLSYQLCQARRAEVDRRLDQPKTPAGRARHPRRPEYPRGTRRSVRQSMGWFLVELGLRLAAPQSGLGTVR